MLDEDDEGADTAAAEALMVIILREAAADTGEAEAEVEADTEAAG